MNGEDKLKTFYENKCNIMEKKIEITRKNSFTKNKSTRPSSSSLSKSKVKTIKKDINNTPQKPSANHSDTIDQSKPSLPEYIDYTTSISLSKTIHQTKTLTPMKYSFKPTLPMTSLNHHPSNSIAQINNRAMTNINKQSYNIVKDNKYRLYLHNVFIQRRAFLKKKNKTKEEISREKFKSFYEHNMTFLNEKDNKIKALKLSIETIDNESCTFKPKLSYSKSQVVISKTAQNISPRHMYKKNQEWLMKISKMITAEKDSIDKERMKECTFQPNQSLNNNNDDDNDSNNVKKKHRKISRSITNNYMYLKNLDWLKKIKLKLKQAREDNIKSHKNKIEQLKEQNSKLIKLAESKSFLTSKEHLDQLAKPKTLQKAQSAFNFFKNDYRKSSNIITNNNYASSKGNQITLEANTESIKVLISGLKQSVKENKNMITLLQHKYPNTPK